MQICHTLEKEFIPERFDTLSVVFLWLISICARLLTGSNTHYLSVIAMAVSMFDCFRFFIKISRRMAKMLNIHVFAFTEKKKLK